MVVVIVVVVVVVVEIVVVVDIEVVVADFDLFLRRFCCFPFTSPISVSRKRCW